MRSIVAFLALTVAVSAPAAVYKWVQPDGSVVYSDRAPVENTAPTELPALQEIKMPPPPPSSPDSTASTPSRQSRQHTDYTKLQITTPADQSAFRNNAGKVTVNLDLEPALQEGDSIAIIFDGKEIGEGKSTAVSRNNVDRGTHTLGAVVKDSQGDTLIKAAPITFTLQRTSVLLQHTP